MVQHVFAEIALTAIGSPSRVIAQDVTIFPAGDILRRADRDIIGTAECVVVFAEAGNRNLAALRTGGENNHQSERDW